jgi:thiamine-monophosphate kinase
VVEAARVPLSPAARAVVAKWPARIVSLLTGGDDYEILFTAPVHAAAELAALSRLLDVPITPIGRIHPPTAGSEDPVEVLDSCGQPLALGRGGWSHFS